MNLKTGDTIAAVATAAGKAGIGVVRISGAAAAEIARQLSRRALKPRVASYRRFRDSSGRVIDEGIAILYKAPASFTGEDVLELQAHGSPLVLDMLLARVLQLGARLAEPGEFSQRAFLNNKYDLLQLEAIADLINSASQQAAAGAQRALQGETSARFIDIATRIKQLRIPIEAMLDFADEDIGHFDSRAFNHELAEVITAIQQLQNAARQAVYWYQGAVVVIAGAVNVGKSSLLNRLAARSEVIVSEQPGTTRDIVSRELLIDGLPVRFVDTAGIRESADPIEQEGIRRAYQAMQSADLVLLLIDARCGIAAAERELLKQLADSRVLVVANKIDLLEGPPTNSKIDPQIDAALSAKTGAGLEALKTRIKHALIQGNILTAEGSVLFANQRHISALAAAQEALSVIELATIDEQRLELVAEDLRIAHQALASITGAYSSEDLLGDIFSNFCIGK